MVVLPVPGRPSYRYMRLLSKPPPRISSRPTLPVEMRLGSVTWSTPVDAFSAICFFLVMSPITGLRETKRLGQNYRLKSKVPAPASADLGQNMTDLDELSSGSERTVRSTAGGTIDSGMRWSRGLRQSRFEMPGSVGDSDN